MEVEMARRLGAWDCSYCSTKKILGNVFDCPGCGHPRPRGVHFYQIPDGPIVTPEIAEQLGSGGPNWYCEHCDSGNKDDAVNCWNCGAPKGSSPSHKVTDYKQGESPQNAEDAKKTQGDSWVIPVLQAPAKPMSSQLARRPAVPQTVDESIQAQLVEMLEGLNPRHLISGAIGLVAFVLMSIFVYNMFFNTRIENANSASFSWTQNVRVEQFSVVHKTSWTSHPADAYNISQSWRDTGRDLKVHDGWTTETYTDTCYRSESYSDTCTRSVYESKTCTGSRDNGDGSFESYTYECGSSTTESYSCTKTRDVPYSCEKTRDVEIYHYEDIYDNFFEYDVNRWVIFKNYPSSGNDHKPRFHEVELKNAYISGSPVLGQQRKFKETGVYTVFFTCANEKIGENGSFSKEYSLSDWSRFKLDGTYQIEVNYFNQILTYPQP